MEQEFDYDLFVIGGGSGGLSCSRSAAKLGVKVAVADYVKPSPPGSKWGLGGTCVNVGCIPKKLMHFSGMLGELRQDQKHSGWEVDPNCKHNWSELVSNVQMHIKSLNYGYKTTLNKEQVKYFNRLGRLIDNHTVELYNESGDSQRVRAENIVIAVGGRPQITEPFDKIKQYVITSDDLFSMKKPPGKTLVIGASYVALECAGFLTAVGFDTTVMVRSILLRGFDQDMAKRIGSYMEKNHTKFLMEFIPVSAELLENKQIRVGYRKTNGPDTDILFDTFDTVMVATGRYPDTKALNLEAIGVKIDKSGKIIVNEAEMTSVSNIFAIGDCALGRPELTPPAIMAGNLLARRLFAGSKILMDYINIATAVFTPIEYGAVGYSEEDAIEKFGRKNISVYHTTFKPLEWNFFHERADDCYVKMIVNKADNKKVVGLHYLGPHAGEVIQGYAVAVKMGVTKANFDNTVGIHPTCSEEIVDLHWTKEENPEAKKTGC